MSCHFGMYCMDIVCFLVTVDVINCLIPLDYRQIFAGRLNIVCFWVLDDDGVE